MLTWRRCAPASWTSRVRRTAVLRGRPQRVPTWKAATSPLNQYTTKHTKKTGLSCVSCSVIDDLPAPPIVIAVVVAIVIVVTRLTEMLRLEEQQVGVGEANTKNWLGLSPLPTGGAIVLGKSLSLAR